MSNEAYQKVDKAFNDVYLIVDPFVVKLIIAMVVSHRLPCDPVWCFIVGSSGAGKTEFVNSIQDTKNVYPLSTLTSKTFVSGMKRNDKEPSLLFRIGSGIIVLEDFTTITSENREELGAIMGQLRAIYGGRFSKAFGTGETMEWEGKITLLCGATYAIHSIREQYAAMGERFLIYNLIQPDRIEAARRAMSNQGKGDLQARRKEISQIVGNYLDNELIIPETIPQLDNALTEELLELAELATRARSAVERDWRSPNKDITAAYDPEMPTRFAGQLQTIAQSLMVVNQNCGMPEGTLTEEDHHILYKMTLDSINSNKRKVLQELARYDVIETAGLATKMKFPTSTTRRWLEDLNALKIVERQKGGGRSGDKWEMKPKYRQIIQKFEKISALTGELNESTAVSEAIEIVPTPNTPENNVVVPAESVFDNLIPVEEPPVSIDNPLFAS